VIRALSSKWRLDKERQLLYTRLKQLIYAIQSELPCI